MYWLFILRCENEYFEIFCTNKLYTEIAKHLDEQYYETYINKPIAISAIYSASTFDRYLQIVNLFKNGQSLSESFKLLIDNFNLRDTYIPSLSSERGEREYVSFLENSLNKLNDHPCCYCHIPCDVKKSIKGNLYYCCARKNIWSALSDEFSSYLTTDIACEYHEMFWILSED